MIIYRHPLVIKLLAALDKYGLLRVIRYGMVGVCAAGAHALMAMAAFHMMNIDPTISNFMGFVTGAVISYFGSYYFTFKSAEGHKKMLPRFGLVWLIGIAVNVGLFKAMLTAFELPYAVYVFIAIALTPIAQYLMLRFWAFKDSVKR